MTFGEVYDKFIEDIEATAYSQYVAGMDHEDIVSEMVGCLWKAWKTHDAAKGSLGGYWWTLWLHKRRDLNRDATRIKRPQTVLASNEYMVNADNWPDQTYVMRPLLAPRNGPPRDVWRLIAIGCSPSEIMRMTGLSKRSYYSLINGWRTQEVWDFLTLRD